MKRIAALMLLVCLTCALCGCGSGGRAAVLCAYEAQSAGQAMCNADDELSCAAAESDAAVLRMIESGAVSYGLVTEGTQVKDTMHLGDVWLSAFHILSNAGRLSEWTKNTRVVIVGGMEDYGSVLAQQALTCAHYGVVRYEDADEALDALKDGRADAVMGMFAPDDERVQNALKDIKGLTLESMPEGLINVTLPDECMENYMLTVSGQQAQTYALPGVLVVSEDGGENRAEEERVIDAARKAGLLR